MKDAIHLVFGEDDFLVDTRAKALADAWVPPAERAFGLEIIDGRAGSNDAAIAAVRACIESVQTVSLFGGAKLTWLRDAVFLGGGGRSFDSKAVKDAVACLVELAREGLPDGQRLLISARNLPRNATFYKAFQKAGQVIDLGGDVKPWERSAQAVERVQTLLPRFELTMEAGVCEEFVERVGFDTRLLAQELEKLRVYIGHPGAVQAAEIRAIVSLSHAAEANDLTAAVGERRLNEVIPILRRLLDQGESAIKLCAMLDGRVNDMLVLRELLDRKWLMVGKNSRLPRADWVPSLPPEAEPLLAGLDPDPRKRTAWQLGRPAAQALNYTLRELRLARHLLIELREKLVSTGLSEAFLIETTLLKIVARSSK